MMNSDFQYINGELYSEKVPVKKKFEDLGTPVYIYSHNSIRSSFLEYKEAFSEIGPLIRCSVKANSNIRSLSYNLTWGGTDRLCHSLRLNR